VLAAVDNNTAAEARVDMPVERLDTAAGVEAAGEAEAVGALVVATLELLAGSCP